MSGKNVDPQKYRAQNEKLTDKIRGFLEKATGKKVCVCVLKRRKLRMRTDIFLLLFRCLRSFPIDLNANCW